jgi:hypothetical protein
MTTQTLIPQHAPGHSRKLKGKIAQLPKNQRDLINKMLDGGATYAVIAAEMTKHGVFLNGENLSNWFQSGYQDYLQRQDWFTQTRLLREDATDLPDPANLLLHQSVLQVAVLKIFESLKVGQTSADPVSHIRQLNVLARLSRLSAHIKKQAHAEAAKLQELDPDESPPTTSALPGPEERTASS